MIPVHPVSTRPSISARRGRTLINVDAAVFAGESGPAPAFIVVVEDQTFAAVRTGFCKAQVYSGLASRAHEAGRTLAALSVDEVDAGAAVFAHDASAVVNVDFTSVSSEARSAGAFEAVAGSRAGSAVAAWTSCAGIGLEGAVRTGVAHRTHAHVAGVTRLAHAAVSARLVAAREATRLAPRTIEALRTGARQLAALVRHAGTTVQARQHGARVQRLFAVRPGVLGRAHARVAALASVVARAAVVTRLVVGAVVEVLVAEQAAPALLADAVPGPRARAAHTARVPLAPVAQLAHPARMTTGIKRQHSLVHNRT